MREPCRSTADRVRRRRGRPGPDRKPGFTLIELTVVLAVLVTLTLILTPTIANFVSDARITRAHNDVQTLATAIVQFYKDTGFFPQWSAANLGGPGLSQNRVELLVGPGNTPAEALPTQWTTAGRIDTLQSQLITNAPGYSMRTARSEFGWNGPLLSSEIGPDPWGNRYMVNVDLLDPSRDARNRSAVWVISAGPNGTVETPFAQIGLAAALGGDDVGIRLQ